MVVTLQCPFKWDVALLRSSYVLVSLGAVAWRSYSTSGVRHGQVIDLLACRKVGPRFDFMPGTLHVWGLFIAEPKQ